MKKKLSHVLVFIAVAIIVFQAGLYGTDSSFIDSYYTQAAQKYSIPFTPVVNQTVAQISNAFTVPVAYGQSTDNLPEQLIIPSINLNSPVRAVGVNAKGEMDVPSGKTNNTGWYKDGVIPGDGGSAVIDGHVFAAFKNLKNVKVGDDVYVVTHGGKKLHFVVEETTVYDLANVPLQKLFIGDSGVSRLNLITCAGSLTADGSTYTKRLIVSAKLEN